MVRHADAAPSLTRPADFVCARRTVEIGILMLRAVRPAAGIIGRRRMSAGSILELHVARAAIRIDAVRPLRWADTDWRR